MYARVYLPCEARWSSVRGATRERAMPITMNEWLESAPRATMRQEREAARLHQRAKASQMADEARTVVTHPGWQKFVDALTVQLVNAERSVEQAQQALVERPLTG